MVASNLAIVNKLRWATSIPIFKPLVQCLFNSKVPNGPTNNTDKNRLNMITVENYGSRLNEIFLKRFTFYTTQERIFLVAEKKPSNETVDEIIQFTTTLVTSNTIPSWTSAERKRTNFTIITVLVNVLVNMVTKLEKENAFVVTAFFLVSTMRVILRLVLESTFRTDGLVNGPSNVARNTRL